MKWKIMFALLACFGLDGTPGEQGRAGDGAPVAVEVNADEIESAVILVPVAKLRGAIDLEEQRPSLTCLPSRAATDRRGRFYVVPPCATPPAILVYAADGSLLTRIGPDQETPISLSSVHRLFISQDDVLHVIEDSGHELMLSPSYATLERRPLPALPYDAVLLRGGRVVLQASIGTPTRAGLPLHLLDTERGLRLSFGALTPHHSLTDPISNFREIAYATEDSVWSAPVRADALDLWTLDGVHVRRFLRRATWREAESDRKPPELRGLHQDAAGRVWALFTLSQDEDLDLARPTAARLNASRDSVLEALDPETGRLLASFRSDLALFGWGEDLVFSFTDEPGGSMGIQVWRVQLLPTKTRR